MSRNLDRSLARFARVSEPPEVLEQRQGARRVYDKLGNLLPPAIEATRQPEKFVFQPSDTGAQPAARAGTMTLIGAYATTAPTTGDATITITKVTEFGGAEALPVLTIPQNANFGAQPVAVPYEAAAMFTRAVTDAQGASGITVYMLGSPRS